MAKRTRAAAILTAAVLGVAMTDSASAATWVPTAAGSTYAWNVNNVSNWSTGSYPNATGAVADVNNDIAGNQTIALNVPISLGALNLGDSGSGTSNTFTIQAGTSGSLTMQGVNAGDATAITVTTTGTAINNQVNAPITLGGTSPLTVTANGLQTFGFSSIDTNGNALTLSTSNTAAGAITASTISGTGALTKAGMGNILLSGTSSSYSGAVTITGGKLVVASGALGYLGSADVTVIGNATGLATTGGSALELGASVAAPTFAQGRLNDSAVVTLKGGGIRYLGSNTAGTTSETIKTVDINSGNCSITITSGATTQSELLLTDLTRSSGATLQLRGNTLGSASGTVNTTRIVITNPGTLVGGNGGAAATNASIYPWMVGGGNTSNEASDFVTYGANGLVMLSAYAAVPATTGGAVVSDVNVASGSLGISNNLTVNSLKFTNGGSINVGTGATGGKSLTLTSGALLFSNGTGGIASSSSSNPDVLNFGAAEGIVTSLGKGTNAIGAVISGSNGMTKAGTGTLTLSGVNNYTGTTTVAGGILKAGAVGVLPSATAVVLANANYNTLSTSPITVAATLDLNSFDQTVGSLAGGGIYGGNVTLGTAKLTTGGNNASTTYGGVISGIGATALEKTGSGTFTLAGANTYTGLTKISAGKLKLGASGVLADASAMELAGGTLDTGGFSEVVGALALTANSTIDMGATGNSVLNFADSSLASWTGGTNLQILNWDGLGAGGGNDRLFFGSTASALSVAQLSQISFVDPAGDTNPAPGTLYPASILSSGEVVALVPEPATLALMGIGGLALSRRRRAQ